MKLRKIVTEENLPYIIGLIWLMPTLAVIATPYAVFGYLCSYFISREIMFER